MLVEDLPQLARGSDCLVTVGPAVSVVTAADLMSQRGVGAVLVLDDDARLCGIFTERDLVTRVIAGRRVPAETTVGQVMTTTVVTVRSHDTAANCMKRMVDGHFRHLPVTDADGRVVGILSQRDFLGQNAVHTGALGPEAALVSAVGLAGLSMAAAMALSTTSRGLIS